MPKSYQQLQENLTFDEMMCFLDHEFQLIPDHRSGNALRYELADVFKSAFAMFSLKSPSMLDFKKQALAEESNLHTIYQITGEIPCDNQMRAILDPLGPSYLRPLFRASFLRLLNAGIIREYQYWHKYVDAKGMNKPKGRADVTPSGL